MGCGNCGSGKPNGCKSNGGCSTGGCNRLNTFDWLSNLSLGVMDSPQNYIEVSFKNGSRKDYFINEAKLVLKKGDLITVESAFGYDIGEVSLTGALVNLQLKKKGLDKKIDTLKKVLHSCSSFELESYNRHKKLEKTVLARSREIALDLKLKMKLSEVEIQADGRKATFFYTNEGYVDFRDLIKLYAKEFRFKIEMRQIGIRQEAGKIGGVGSCGRELCCSTWLVDFKNVSSSITRYQNISFNQDKITGQCGKLKCCLNYELDTYLDALQNFPEVEVLQTSEGTAKLLKKEILKNLMVFVLPNRQHIALTIPQVNEYISINKSGKKIEIADNKTSKASVFVDGGGEISLKSLERQSRKDRNQGGYKKNNYKTYLETNGTLPKELEKVIKFCDIVAMDLKPSSSTEDRSFWTQQSQFLKIAIRKEVFVKLVVTPQTTKEDIAKCVDLV
ncbi:MAG: regulatory iron-sulfur-containing complex subunit RicT, partial [Sediminibacterium sp.]|nr:regulatory iron-sulfur-containing complex subunit RicT [Sediminibacterium sp.]